MTVYACLGRNYDDSWITGIFTTRAAAETHKTRKDATPSDSGPLDIEEWQLDEDSTLTTDDTEEGARKRLENIRTAMGLSR